MYKDTSQLKIEDFVFPYGNLDPENDWVKLAGLVPWETAEERYAAQFADNGAPNGGTLVLDATCCPAGIAYPQDVNLLNQGCTASLPAGTFCGCPRAKSATPSRFIPLSKSSCNTSGGI